jgi:hypothetical protein
LAALRCRFKRRLAPVRPVVEHALGAAATRAALGRTRTALSSDLGLPGRMREGVPDAPPNTVDLAGV